MASLSKLRRIEELSKPLLEAAAIRELPARERSVLPELQKGYIRLNTLFRKRFYHSDYGNVLTADEVEEENRLIKRVEGLQEQIRLPNGSAADQNRRDEQRLKDFF
jgi:hypothetical protein